MGEVETVEIVFEPSDADAPLTFEAGYGTERLDTADHCGETDKGFGLLVNWNLLGEGVRMVRAYGRRSLRLQYGDGDDAGGGGHAGAAPDA